MLNDQVMGLLQNNAGNPDIVRRIAEENQLSQAEIAQALRIPDGSAARYVSGMNPEQGPGVATIDNGMASKPAMGGAVPQKPPMAAQIPLAQVSGPAGMSPASVAGSAANAMTAGSAGGGMGSGMGAGIPAAVGSRTADMGMTKPAKLPPDMKPQGLRGEFRQVRPPSNTAIPEDEMAFSRGFERIRGARA